MSLTSGSLRGKRAAVLLFSHYPADPRPRRAAEALVREGMHVEVICLRASNDEATRETFNGVEIRRLPIKRRRGGPGAYLAQYSAFILSTFVLLALRSLRHRIALIHVHNMPDALVVSALVPKMLGARVILDLHDPMPELMQTIFGLGAQSAAVRLLKRLERWSISLADVVVTVNLACKRLFASRSCGADKICVVMNAPDEAIFTLREPCAKPPRPDKPFVIMYHGLIVERNGLDVLTAALALVEREIPDVQLRIYGDATPFFERVMEGVRSNGLQQHVRYFGRKGLEDIVAAIDECDVGVIPNRRAIFTEINTPTRIFEYLSRGKPVITGRAPGVCDYFTKDDLLLFELGDARDLADRIIHVFHHRERAASVVSRGQQVYLSHRWSEERRRFVERVAELLSS